MSLGRTMMRLAFLAAIGHQVTYTLVEGGIFAGTRTRISSVHPKLEEFIHCHLCVGTWSGIVLAGVYQPNLLADAVGHKPPSGPRRVANLAGDAVLIALGTRVWNEVLGLVRRQVQLKQQTVEAIEPADLVTVERPSMPGISARS
ncbi:MAG: hypothetical protein M3077_13065 [Candidatus Dormibacteraeota bacterium]|nr:hypothetical protein [Candidatus Dormibacteraeota bacterium]